MSHYKHITPEEREKILLLHSQNCTITYIANSIGRDKSTIANIDPFRLFLPILLHTVPTVLSLM